MSRYVFMHLHLSYFQKQIQGSVYETYITGKVEGHTRNYHNESRGSPAGDLTESSEGKKTCI